MKLQAFNDVLQDVCKTPSLYVGCTHPELVYAFIRGMDWQNVQSTNLRHMGQFSIWLNTQGGWEWWIKQQTDKKPFKLLAKTFQAYVDATVPALEQLAKAAD